MSLPQMIGLALIILAFWKAWPRRDGRSPGKAGTGLDKVLFTWANTPFLLRHLYQSILILGAAGSGKTSGSGKFLFKILLSIPNSGGIIIASKPEERFEVTEAFRKAGREKDLLFFGPNDKLRCNLFDALAGDANNLVNALDVMAELMSGEKGNGKDDPFWPRKRKETFYHAIVILQQAGVTITSFAILCFISEAADSAETFNNPKWRTGFHWETLQKALGAEKARRQQFDYQAAYLFWSVKWPQMAEKTRSNIEAEVTGVLHPMNTGVVRDLIGTTTDVSPKDMEEGKWLFVDMPLQVYGESGRFVGGALKYIVGRYILARHATGDAGPIATWIDEAHNYLTKHDVINLAEQRSHRGVAVYLSQSLHSFTTTLGDNHANALMTNFATKIFHQLGDAKSAEYASSLLGQRIAVRTGGGNKPGQGAFDAPTFDPNFNEQWEPVLQSASLMTGLRTSGGEVDAIVIRADPFESGERYAKIAFKQE